jgi:L-ascorbate metabolism protein UlaG (beta-lactamase superfamily)
MKIRGIDIELLNHDSVKIKYNKWIIYVDPFQIPAGEEADFILISHEHEDHCSPMDLKKIIKPETIIIASQQCKDKLSVISKSVNQVHYLRPNENIKIGEFFVETVPAYNVNKFRAPGIVFHPKEDQKLGFIINLKLGRIYHPGDTDVIPEMSKLRDIDIAFLPVSGTYVMTAEEAAKAVEIIKPKVAIPFHYGAIIGSREDAEKFKSLAKCRVEILK